jgi:hAT family C-terminal dimerisation region
VPDSNPFEEGDSSSRSLCDNLLFSEDYMNQAVLRQRGSEDEADRYLGMGLVSSNMFMNPIQWWDVRKTNLLAHYLMACDYLGTPATYKPCEHLNSASGREFTSIGQSLSTTLFIQTMSLRSWMAANCVTVPRNWRKSAAKIISAPGEATNEDEQNNVKMVTDGIEIDQDDWNEMEDGAADILNARYESTMLEMELLY